MRVATGGRNALVGFAVISIHATHAGGDARVACQCKHFLYFNPRHPCGWRPSPSSSISARRIFQSTPPMRVATGGVPPRREDFNDFNPRHPCGWRRNTKHPSWVRCYFNPRHPCGWRQNIRMFCGSRSRFQSTPPMRVATPVC